MKLKILFNNENLVTKKFFSSNSKTSNYTFKFGSVLTLIFILMMFGCEKTADNKMITDDNLNVTNSADLLRSAVICEVSLIAAQNITVGTVSSEFNDAGDQLTVTYAITNTEWCIIETHLDAQTDPDKFPLTNSGNPKVGQFAYGGNLSCEALWSQSIDLSTIDGWMPGDKVYIAANASVQNDELEEGAWGAGDPFPGNNWAMYFDCSPICFVYGDPLTDPRDGLTYNTIQIGTQSWMAENLRYEPNSGNYWAYDNNVNNIAVYGYLYDWVTACDVCPDGWHLPTDAEWTVLTSYLGTDAGGKMKETGTTHWSIPNAGATNTSGFTALPGGYHLLDGSFKKLGLTGYWWSATEGDPNSAWSRELYYNHSDVIRAHPEKPYGYSVRCVKNNN